MPNFSICKCHYHKKHVQLCKSAEKSDLLFGTQQSWLFTTSGTPINQSFSCPKIRMKFSGYCVTREM